MAKNELCITVPSYFNCPISLQLMKSPVSLSTGITYDRASIQHWLDAGHTTCPATMQPLSSPSFVPNRTLHRLIHLWSLSNLPPSPTPLINQLINSNNTNTPVLINILDRINNSPDNRRVFASSDEFVASVVRLWNQFDDQLENLKIVLLIMNSILSENDRIGGKLHDCSLHKFVYVLRNGSNESKVAAASVLAKIAIDAKSKRLMIETPNLLSELYNLVTPPCDPSSIESGLSAMIAIARLRSVKLELIRMGTVKSLTEILCEKRTPEQVVQRSMEMLELLSTVPEGRTAVCEDEKCVAEIVGRLMKMPEKATQHGVTVIWSVCYLYPDEKAKAVAAMCNAVGRCLLVLQSNCSAMVKQMCRDLVKVLRVNSNVCLTRYDTKTIHIMPY